MSNQQLYTYVKQQMQSGTSNEEIKKLLIESSWKTQDIDEAFRFVQESDDSHQKRKYVKHLTLVAIAAMLFATTSYAVVILLDNKEEKNNILKLVNIDQSSVVDKDEGSKQVAIYIPQVRYVWVSEGEIFSTDRNLNNREIILLGDDVDEYMYLNTEKHFITYAEVLDYDYLSGSLSKATHKILNIKNNAVITLKAYDLNVDERELEFSGAFLRALMEFVSVRGNDVYYMSTDSDFAEIKSVLAKTLPVESNSDELTDFPDKPQNLVFLYKLNLETNEITELMDLPVSVFGFDTGIGVFVPEVMLTEDGAYAVSTKSQGFFSSNKVEIVNTKNLERKKVSISVCDKDTQVELESVDDESVILTCHPVMSGEGLVKIVKFLLEEPEKQIVLNEGQFEDVKVSPNNKWLVLLTKSEGAKLLIQDLYENGTIKEVELGGLRGGTEPTFITNDILMSSFSKDIDYTTFLGGRKINELTEDEEREIYTKNIVLINAQTGEYENITNGLVEGVNYSPDNGGFADLKVISDSESIYYALTEYFPDQQEPGLPIPQRLWLFLFDLESNSRREVFTSRESLDYIVKYLGSY